MIGRLLDHCNVQSMAWKVDNHCWSFYNCLTCMQCILLSHHDVMVTVKKSSDMTSVSSPAITTTLRCYTCSSCRLHTAPCYCPRQTTPLSQTAVATALRSWSVTPIGVATVPIVLIRPIVPCGMMGRISITAGKNDWVHKGEVRLYRSRPHVRL